MICILLLSTLQALHGWQCDWVFLEETEFHIRVYVCVVNVIVVVVYGTNINLSEYYTVPCRTYIYMYTDVGSPFSRKSYNTQIVGLCSLRRTKTI